MVEYYNALCACGCNGRIPITSKTRKELPTYIKGHSRKGKEFTMDKICKGCNEKKEYLSFPRGSRWCKKCIAEETRKRRREVNMKNLVDGCWIDGEQRGCYVCSFSDVTDFHHISKTETVILCPNHHAIIHRLGGLIKKVDGRWLIEV